MKASWAGRLADVPGGKEARREVAIMKVTMLSRLPPINVHRRPTLSMKRRQMNCATRATIALKPWNMKVSEPEMPVLMLV